MNTPVPDGSGFRGNPSHGWFSPFRTVPSVPEFHRFSNRNYATARGL